MEYPKLSRIKNHFTDNSIQDIRHTLRNELCYLSGTIPDGASIAIAVGSRGIDNLPIAVKEVVEFVVSQNATPFIIPAMGSHGGATAEGQKEVLAGYGITKESMGVEVRSSMEVAELPGSKPQRPIFMDKNAYESDGVILVNKIKPHTDFHSKYESGLVKMAVIGLGKEHGAKAIHHFGVKGLTEVVPKTAKQIFASKKIIGGVALVENAYDKTMLVNAIPGNEIMKKEPALLELAKANRPTFPTEQFDLLIIDRMGKNISGVGIDTNVIGRLKIYGQEEPESPRIKSIMVSDLTDESHGNATGTGLADVITKKLYDKIDFDITYKNIATSSFLERGKIPFVAANDLEGFQLAMRNCGFPSNGKERIIRIKDTLHLDELLVSNAILKEIKGNQQIEVIDHDIPLFNGSKDYAHF